MDNELNSVKARLVGEEKQRLETELAAAKARISEEQAGINELLSKAAKLKTELSLVRAQLAVVNAKNSNLRL